MSPPPLAGGTIKFEITCESTQVAGQTVWTVCGDRVFEDLVSCPGIRHQIYTHISRELMKKLKENNAQEIL